MTKFSEHDGIYYRRSQEKIQSSNLQTSLGGFSQLSVKKV